MAGPHLNVRGHRTYSRQCHSPLVRVAPLCSSACPSVFQYIYKRPYSAQAKLRCTLKSCEVEISEDTWFSVHARKAWLKGLSPKENRNVPPLRYDEVYRLKEDFPHLDVEINGGVVSLNEALGHLDKVDGVMIGRAAYDTPWMFAEADERAYGDPPDPRSRFDVALAMIPYAEAVNADGQPTHRVTRHMLNLFAGTPGTKRYKRALTERGRAPAREAIMAALNAVRSARSTMTTW